MLSLIFVLIVIGVGVVISIVMNTGDITWLVYYRGGIVGLFMSGVILYALNERKRVRELKKKK